jgi:plastocyanin
MSARRKTLLAILMVPMAVLLTLGSVSIASAHPAGHLAANQIDRTPKIVISMFAFTVPRHVAPGALVKVVNKDAADHTVTADDLSFDVAVPGNSTVTFNAPANPGKYIFHCRIHHSMKSKLVVK